MKLLLNRQDAIKKLAFVKSVAPLDDTAKITASNNSIIIECVSSVVATRVKLDGSIIEDGAVIFNVEDLLKINKEVKVDNVQIECDDTYISIKANKAKFKIPVLSNYKGMEIQECDDLNFSLPGIELKKIIHKSSFACCKEELRAVLTGIYFKAENGCLSIASTDSIILTEQVIEIKNEEEFEMIMPSSTMELIKNVIKDTDTVGFIFIEERAQISFGDYIVVSKTIEGRFPGYKSIIPTETLLSVSFDRMQMLELLQRISVVCNPLSRIAKLKVENNNLKFEADDTSRQAVDEMVAVCEEYKYKIGFNITKLMSALKHLDGESVNMHICSNSSPVKFLEENYTIIVMPLKISEE